MNNFTSFLLFSFSSAWITIESELIISTMKLQSATIGWWNQEFMMIALIWLTGFSKGFELQTSWGHLCKKCNLKNVGGRVSKNEVRSQEPFHCVNHFYILNPTMFQRLSDFINNIYMENHNLPGSNIEEARSHISTQILWINLDCSISIVMFWLIINWFRYLGPWGSAGAVFVYQVIKW